MASQSHAVIRARLLREATRLIAAGREADLDAVLDALADCVRVLLGADSALVNLGIAGSSDLVRRRPNPFVPTDHPLARAPARFQPDPLTAEAIARRRSILIADFHGDPRISSEAKAAMPRVVASLTVPLVAGDTVVGVLFAHWTRRHALASEDLTVVETLAQHAAVAILLGRRHPGRDAAEEDRTEDGEPDRTS
jgi:GAF domain-containing protein